MNTTILKSIGMTVLAAALQALIQSLFGAHGVDPSAAAGAGGIGLAAYLATSPLKK